MRSQIYTPERLAPYLRGAASSVRVEGYRSTDSTNRLAVSAAAEGKVIPTLFLAEGQTAGRGREGRTFHSPSGGGLYMSLLLPFNREPSSLSAVTPAAAVAVAESVESVFGVRLVIKWVNDLFLGGRKVAGILSQASLGEGGYVIIGIGINVTPPKEGFRPEIENIAGALVAGATEEELCRLAGEITCRLCERMADLSRPELFGEYRRRLFFLGERVTVSRGGELYEATALDIADDFSLILQSEKGIERLSSGEIRIKIKV